MANIDNLIMPVKVLEFQCGECSKYFLTPFEYNILGCPFCGRGATLPTGESLILGLRPIEPKVEVVKEEDYNDE